MRVREAKLPSWRGRVPFGDVSSVPAQAPAKAALAENHILSACDVLVYTAASFYSGDGAAADDDARSPVAPPPPPQHPGGAVLPRNEGPRRRREPTTAQVPSNASTFFNVASVRATERAGPYGQFACPRGPDALAASPLDGAPLHCRFRLRCGDTFQFERGSSTYKHGQVDDDIVQQYLA